MTKVRDSKHDRPFTYIPESPRETPPPRGELSIKEQKQIDAAWLAARDIRVTQIAIALKVHRATIHRWKKSSELYRSWFPWFRMAYICQEIKRLDRLMDSRNVWIAHRAARCILILEDELLDRLSGKLR